MIRRAAAYATAAAIGSVVGTFTGAILGAALVIVAYEGKKTAVVNNFTDISGGRKSEEKSEDGNVQSWPRSN